MLASCRPCARCPRSRRSSGCRGSFCPCSGGACCIARSAVAAKCRLLVSPLGVHPGGGPPASAVRAASFARSVVLKRGQAPHSRHLPGLSETGCASVGAGFARSETGSASVGAGFARSETAGTIVGEKQAFSVRCLLSVVSRVSCVGWAGLSVVLWVSCVGWAGLSVVLWVSCVGWAGLAVVPWVSCAGRSGLVVVSWVSSARREQPEGAPGVRCLYLGRAQDPRPRVQWPSGLPVGASRRAPSTGYPHDSVYFGDNVADPYI